jgi:hypothetical protein
MIKSRLVIAVILLCFAAIAECGAFQLSGVAPDNCWYRNDDGNDVTSATRGAYYEYNQYRIRFSAEPCEAVIEWNGKEIGTTPFKYLLTGKFFTDEDLTVRAVPLDGKFRPRLVRMNLYRQLPRIIHFDFTKD